MDLLDFIPDTMMPVFDADTGDKNPRRLTLLYKSRDHVVCLLSRGIEEVAYDRPVQDAFLFKIFGPRKVEVEYEDQLTFAECPIGSQAYATVTQKSADTDTKEFKIPFYQPGQFVSEVVDETLDQQIHDLFDRLNQEILHGCTSMAERGLLRTFLFPGKKARTLSAEVKVVKRRLNRTIHGFFHEECDSIPVPRRLLDPADRKKKNYFDLHRFWSPLARRLKSVAFLPFLAVMPACLIEIMEKSLHDSFQKRFDRITDDKEKEMVALGEFAMANPKFVGGIKRFYTEVKAAMDLATYALQVGVTWLEYQSAPVYVSIFWILPTLLTGLVKINNAWRSGGRDFSGIISTALNRALLKKHHLTAVRTG